MRFYDALQFLIYKIRNYPMLKRITLSHIDSVRESALDLEGLVLRDALSDERL